MSFEIAIEPPSAPDVTALLERHLQFCHSVTEPEGVFALDVSGISSSDITLFGLREDGELLGICALRELDETHGEIKSMHTATWARGRGVAKLLLNFVLEQARARGLVRVSLETSPHEAFLGARALYSNSGFVICEAFGSYQPAATSVFMSKLLEADEIQTFE